MRDAVSLWFHPSLEVWKMLREKISGQDEWGRRLPRLSFDVAENDAVVPEIQPNGSPCYRWDPLMGLLSVSFTHGMDRLMPAACSRRDRAEATEDFARTQCQRVRQIRRRFTT